jgi:hypothetical protein
MCVDVPRDLAANVGDWTSAVPKWIPPHVLACVECPRVSSATARGWKAYRVEDQETDETPRLAFYCADCAEREFGGWSRRV